MSLVIRWSGLRALSCLGLALLLIGCSPSGTPTATPTPAPTRTVAAAATATLAPTSGPGPGIVTATLPPTPPTATAPPATPTTTATPTRPAPSPGRGTATPAPAGNYPADWRVYQGRLPFAIAYPPDWTVDESQLSSNLIYFFAPGQDQSIFLVIATTGMAEGAVNLDVLRDRWIQSRLRGCDQFAIDQSGQEELHGITYATVGATCDLPTGLAYSYTGLGVRGAVPWIFEFNAPYERYEATLAEVFRPMIQTLNIYGGTRVPLGRVTMYHLNNR